MGRPDGRRRGPGRLVARRRRRRARGGPLVGGRVPGARRRAARAADREPVAPARISGRGPPRHEGSRSSPTGEVLLRVGAVGDGDGRFHFPSAVAVAPDGEVLVVDALNFRVARLDRDGAWRGAFGGEGDRAGEFARPKGIAVGAGGEIYSATPSATPCSSSRPTARSTTSWARPARPRARLDHPAGSPCQRADPPSRTARTTGSRCSSRLEALHEDLRPRRCPPRDDRERRGGAGRVAGSRHNLSASGPGPYRAVSEKDPCIFCHISHLAGPGAGLDNRPDPGRGHVPYGSSTLARSPALPPARADLPLLPRRHHRTGPYPRPEHHDGRRGRAIGKERRSGLGTESPRTHPISFRPAASSRTSNTRTKSRSR